MQVGLNSFYTNLKEANQFIDDIYQTKMHQEVIFKNREFNTLGANDAFKLEVKLKDLCTLSISISKLKSGIIFYNINLYTKNGHSLCHINDHFDGKTKKENKDYMQLKNHLKKFLDSFINSSI